MRHKILFCLLIYILFGCTILLNSTDAYWVWTPGSKKFINPKYAVKDSPKEQYDWAMSFYEEKNYKRALAEFEKLIKHYEFSEYAAKAQYYIGLTYENMGKYFYAFLNYQKVVDYYPHSEDLEEIIRREFELGNYYMAKENPRLMDIDLMTTLDRAIEIFKKVVENAPYGEYADKAQFRLGIAFKRAERYDEAIGTFQELIEEYPDSQLAERAKYELALCAYKASLKPAYDQRPTDKAIEAFERITGGSTNVALVEEASKTLERLRDKAAEKSFLIAKFYERQKKYMGAITYYEEVINRYPDSSFADEARRKIKELRKKLNEK